MKKILYIIIFLLPFSLNAISRYELDGDRFLVSLSMQILKAQVGITEATGNNDGPEVRAFQRTVKMGRGPWCAALQYAVFKFAQDTLNKYDYHSDIPIPRAALANNFANHAAAKGVKTKNIPQYGDLLVWWNRPGNPRSSGHIERIIEVKKAGWVTCIGGNTSNGLKGSQREGNGVFVRKRNIYHRIGSLRPRMLVGINTTLIDRKFWLFKFLYG